MENINIEVSGLKHGFLQILNLSHQLMAKNEVLKAQIKEQEKMFQWKEAEMKKSIEDLKHKNLKLQKKLGIEEDEVSVIGKEFQEVIKGSLKGSMNRELVDTFTKTEEEHFNNQNDDYANIEPDEDDEYLSQDTEKNSSISI